MGTLDINIKDIYEIADVFGSMKGFVHQIGTIAGVILGIVVCRLFGDDVCRWLISPGSEHAAAFKVAVYLLVFIAVFLVVRIIAGLFTRVLGALHIRLADRIAGALFTMGMWLLAASIAVNIYLVVVPSDKAWFSVPGKPWRTALATFAPSLMGYIATGDNN